LPIPCVKRLYTFRHEFNTFSRKLHPIKTNPIVPHPFLQHNSQLKFLPQPNLPVSNFFFSRITNFKFYKYTSSRFYLHSKKASIITTLIDLPTLLNTQPTYLTTSQHTALKHIYKSPSSYPELCQYSRAIFFRYNWALPVLPHHPQDVSLIARTSLNDFDLELTEVMVNQSTNSNLVKTNLRLLKWFRTEKFFYLKQKQYTGYMSNILNKSTRVQFNSLHKVRNKLWSIKMRFTRKSKKIQRNFFNRLKWLPLPKNLMLTKTFNTDRLVPVKCTGKTWDKIKNTTNWSAFQLKNWHTHSRQLNITNPYFLVFFLLNPSFYKITHTLGKIPFKDLSHRLIYTNKLLQVQGGRFSQDSMLKLDLTNLVPTNLFKYTLSKQLSSLFSLNKTREDVIPLFYHTLVRFIEHVSGKKFLFQFYPFLNQNVTTDYLIRYKSWIPRMGSYERRLGHKFFFEEALHIMHLSFILRDATLFANWLKAMILRISFWKTRSIFRFIRYLYLLYFTPTFPELGIKGLKIKLKGKISVAGNSRKRTILYRTGSTSHSQVNLRVSHSKQTINTFTGVMGFQVWIFY